MKRLLLWLPLILLVAASPACTAPSLSFTERTVRMHRRLEDAWERIAPSLSFTERTVKVRRRLEEVWERIAPSLSFTKRTVRGSGNVIAEGRQVSGFDRVSLTGFGRVIITQGDGESLTIETDDNLMQYIETTVTGTTLELGFTDEDKIPDPRDTIIFRLSVIDLALLNSSGAGKFEIDELETDRLEITLGVAGDVKIDSLSVTDLEVTINGAGNIDLSGQAETQVVTLNGLGNYTAHDLESQTVTVRVPGAGSVGVWAVDSLDVTIGGAGSVDYYGSPDVSQEINGVGKLTSRGDR